MGQVEDPVRIPSRRKRIVAVLVGLGVLAAATALVVDLTQSTHPNVAAPADALTVNAPPARLTDPDAPHSPKPFNPDPKPTARRTDAGTAPVQGGAPIYRNQAAPTGVYTSWISIPAQGVMAPIEGTCAYRDGYIEPHSYDPRVTCYWDGGAPLTSSQGETSLLGHINYGGVAGSLGRIGELHPGDRIYTYDGGGHRSSWKVSFIVVTPKTAGVPHGAETGPYGPRTLVMVTCGGPWVGGVYGYADLVWVHAVPA